MMDLSVEAECFGSQIRVTDDEVPTVIGSVVNTMEDAQALQVPQVGAGRTGLYVEAISKALKLITDRPIFASVIGPYSLAGRLMDMTQIMMNCFDEPEMVHATLEKATEFILAYWCTSTAEAASSARRSRMTPPASTWPAGSGAWW